MVMLKKIIIGILAGIISGLFGAGGGLILVPAFVNMLNTDEKKARATSVFCIMPMVIVTAFFYNKNNYIQWNLGIKCAIGGILGGIIGSKLLIKIPNKYLKFAFILFLIYALGFSLAINVALLAIIYINWTNKE